MTNSEKADLYDLIMARLIRVNDWGSLFHYQITIPAMKKQTFEEALRSMKPIKKDDEQ
jgi:hypothetical protein